MKAAIYTRVSTLLQAEEGDSLDLQKERLASYAQSQGWEIKEIYEDAGLSGGSSNRPAFQKLIKDAKQKKFDVVLVYKIDRLSRSILDFHQTIKIFQENNISFTSITQNFDTSTPMGRLMLAILIDFANFEREINVERSLDSYFNRFSKGEHTGKTPFGYVRQNGNNLIIDTERAGKIKRIFELATLGNTTRKIAEELKLGVDRIKTILNNPIYCGYLSPRADKHGSHDTDLSKWIKGSHEAIIPVDLFFSAQKYRKGERVIKHIGIFQKLIYCPYCKHNYTFATRTIKDGKYYFYQCQETSPHGKHCNSLIKEIILENILINGIDKLFSIKIPEQQKNNKNIENEIKRIDRKIEKLLDLVDELPKEKIIQGTKKLQEEKMMLFDKIKTQKKAIKLDIYFKKIAEVYPYMSREEKKRIWNITIEKISNYDDYIEVYWRDGRRTHHEKRALRTNLQGMVRKGGVEPPLGCPTGT